MARTLHTGLGKGLGALLKNVEPDAREKIEQINIASIRVNPFQPRIIFDDSTIDELAESIKKYGILQPVLVKKIDDKYQLITGERRLRACKRANVSTIPAIIRGYSDSEIAQIALIENLQREDLNAIEEASAYRRLIEEAGLTQSGLSKYVGKSRSHIANFLRLLHLSESVKKYIADGLLNMGQAKPLLAIENEKLQGETALYIIANELSAREAENIAKKVLQNPDYFNMQKERMSQVKDVFISAAENRLELLLGAKVNIKKGRKKSKIEIEFNSAEELDRIIETFMEEKEERKKTESKKDFFV